MVGGIFGTYCENMKRAKNAVASRTDYGMK